MFNRHPETRRELGEELARRLERASKRVLDTFRRPVTSAEEEAERTRRLSDRYLVLGRVEGLTTLWDVYELRGDMPPAYVLGGCAFHEEAIAKARDLILGRPTISFGAVRGCFRSVPGSALAVPDRRVDRPGAEVKIYTTPQGTVVAAR